MKNFVVVMLCVVSATLFVSCKNQQQACCNGPLSGVVFDATMNSIVVITNCGDTIGISTMDADPAKVPGVMLGDSVAVICSVQEIDGRTFLKAEELRITYNALSNMIEGSWVMPIDGMENMTHGFMLMSDGKAKSINMATLTILSWSKDGDNLILSSISEGSGRPIESTDTYKIIKHTADSLVLSLNDYITWRLHRQ